MTNGFSWPKGVSAYNEDQYIKFAFSSSNIPTNAIIDSVLISSQYWVNRLITNTKYEVWNGDTFLGSKEISIPSTGCANAIREDVDVSNFINSIDKTNGIVLKFLAYRSSSLTQTITGSIDHVSLVIKYHMPIIPPIAYSQDMLVRSVDTSFPIILTGTSTNSSNLNYVITATPTKGLLDTNSGNTFTYTPTGTIGDDSFDFKVNDGVMDSATSSVYIHLTTGSSSILKITSDENTLMVGSSTIVTIKSFDKFNNPTVADNSTTVSLSSDLGSVGNSVLQLVSGVATSTVSSSIDGNVTFVALSTGLVSASTTIIFLKPVIIPPPLLKPTSSLVSGTYDSVQTITLSTNNDADIYYTTGGVEPSCGSGIHFTEKIKIDSTQTIKAIACDSYNQVSEISIFDYVINIPVQNFEAVIYRGGGGLGVSNNSDSIYATSTNQKAVINAEIIDVSTSSTASASNISAVVKSENISGLNSFDGGISNLNSTVSSGEIQNNQEIKDYNSALVIKSDLVSSSEYDFESVFFVLLVLVLLYIFVLPPLGEK